MDASTNGPRPLEPLALRGFKTVLAATLGTAAFTALIVGTGHALGKVPDLGPSALMGFVAAMHFAKERIGGLLWGRGRLGVPDAFARKLMKDVEAVARREPDGAWVVLSQHGMRVDVLDREGFESVVRHHAVRGETIKVIRHDPNGFMVERYEGGNLRDADGLTGEKAVAIYDRSGKELATRSVPANLSKPAKVAPRVAVTADGEIKLNPWRGPAASPELRYPDCVRPGSALFHAVNQALRDGPVHMRRGSGWVAFEPGGEEPRIVPERIYRRSRRTSRDHVEVERHGDEVLMSRLTFGRLDSAAHGQPAVVAYDAEGRPVREEWYVEGRLSDEATVREAEAGYRSAPMPGMA